MFGETDHLLIEDFGGRSSDLRAKVRAVIEQLSDSTETHFFKRLTEREQPEISALPVACLDRKTISGL